MKFDSLLKSFISVYLKLWFIQNVNFSKNKSEVMSVNIDNTQQIYISIHSAQLCAMHNHTKSVPGILKYYARNSAHASVH